MTNCMPARPATERNLRSLPALTHRRALKHLYERRAAVDSLIKSLERYQRAKERRASVDSLLISRSIG
jgi:hypothetical protein